LSDVDEIRETIRRKNSGRFRIRIGDQIVRVGRESVRQEQN
jgi:hypothetical protein